MAYLNNKQLAARNEGSSPNRAGEQLLKACAVARKQLIARLVKPSIHDETVFEAWILNLAAIRSMDHNELMCALVGK